VPDSGAGVGFGNYSEYIRDREVQERQQGGIVPAAPVFSTEQVGAALDASESGSVAAVQSQSQIGAQATAPLPATRPRGNAPDGIKEEFGEVRSANAKISDEQDFNAVAARESIASDKERLARQRAQYEIVVPKALPQRTGANGPNVVEYALATQHAPGTQLYKRSSFFAKDPLVACARYRAPDLAQEAFLANGGPERDKEGLDPDGDGFACEWDPRPFRAALR
jgi:hypothetical protein